jgi:DNA-binding transcriptional LysR family regulator
MKMGRANRPYKACDAGRLHAWQFERDGERVNGRLAFNSSVPILSAALAGHRHAFIPVDMASAHIPDGYLQRVLTR